MTTTGMPSAFHSASFEAIGVTNQVTVTDAAALDDALAIAQAEIAALDLACSRFLDDSELVALNRAAGAAVRVSPLLLEAVEVALAAAEATDGLVDPTVGRALRALGYDRDFDVVVAAGPRPDFELVPASGWRSVRVEGGVIALRPGSELDVGATAKALGADRVARAVREATGADVLVSLGGDVSVQGAPADGWPVHVTDHHRRPSGPGQTIALRDGGLATSTTTVRRWRAGGVELHHIVDPTSGRPAPERWRTVTVAARTCVDANIASTAAIVLGDAALAWLDGRGLAARLVGADGAVLTTGGWPAG